MLWLKKHFGAALPAVCYACGLLVFLAVHLAGFAQNRVAYASGSLTPGSLSLADFSPVSDLEIDGNTLVTLGKDPQLVLNDAQRRVENFTVTCSAARPPLMQQAFWAAPGRDHSLRSMAYPRKDGRTETFLLPPAGGQSLRWDPDIQAGNRITVERLEINLKRPFWAFFIPSSGEAALYITLPGLFACLCAIGWQSGALPRLRAGLAARRRGAKAGKAGAADD